MGEAQTKRTKAETTMKDLQRKLAAEYPDDEDRSTQNAQTSSSNAGKEVSSRASTLSPPPEVLEEPEWGMEEDSKQQDQEKHQEQQDDDAEDTIVVDTSARTPARNLDERNEQPKKRVNYVKEATITNPKPKYDETTWKRFERPTEKQIQDYLKRGNKIPGYLVPNPCVAPVEIRVKTTSELAAEAAKEEERKQLKEIVSNPKMFDQDSPHWPYRKIYVRPTRKPYEKPPFWVEAKDIPEYIEYCKQQREVFERRVKRDFGDGRPRGAVYVATFDGRKWELVEDLREVKGNGLETWF